MSSLSSKPLPLHRLHFSPSWDTEEASAVDAMCFCVVAVVLCVLAGFTFSTGDLSLAISFLFHLNAPKSRELNSLTDQKPLPNVVANLVGEPVSFDQSLQVTVAL